MKQIDLDPSEWRVSGETLVPPKPRDRLAGKRTREPPDTPGYSAGKSLIFFGVLAAKLFLLSLLRSHI